MMSQGKSILGVLLVFVLGGLAGGFLALSVAHRWEMKTLQRGSPEYEQFLERRLVRGLDLTADQREHFHEALVDNIEQRKRLQSFLQPQMQELNLQLGRAMRTNLKPDQLATFRQNLKDFRQRFGAPGIGTGKAPAAVDNSTPISGGASTNVAPN
jgi:uncharacterized membrane protein